MDLKTKGQRKTPTGKQSTKESELKKMLGLHPIIDNVLKYRELQKLLSTYIDNLPGLVDKDGRIHATFYKQGQLQDVCLLTTLICKIFRQKVNMVGKLELLLLQKKVLNY